ncbi:hypothetical protein KFK09_020880 [Dendrobium nobile]|uniref:Uncharacterized protein n=1 Tax=Dendrobium nobile TaxID=94219 RepID=A0A8T3AN61_DENNO|nr:hypothetical protein KFK09_020880 [Dendrobium nobile]
MVALFDQQLIVWYLITLKLKETIEAYIRKLQEKPITRSIHLSLHKSNPVLKPLPEPKPQPAPWPVVPQPALSWSPLRPLPQPPPPSSELWPVLKRPPSPSPIPHASAPWPVLPRPDPPPSPWPVKPPPPPPSSELWPVLKRPPSPSPIHPASAPWPVLPRPDPPPSPWPVKPPPPPPLPRRPLSPPPLDFPWNFSILQKLEHARQYEASSRCETLSIYRVPKVLRDVDHIAYTPKIVSIGPYHHGRHRFRSMEIHKWRSLHHALARTRHDFRLYLDAARSFEDRARSCYEAPISISSDAFVESLVLDSIFVLELFRGVAREGFPGLGYSPNDPVFAIRGTMHSLQRDMIMLENQLPLFVLDWILALQLGYDPSCSYRVAPLALRFFDPLKPTYDLLPLTAYSDSLNEAKNSRALHCLDVFRLSLKASCPRPRSVVDPLPIADKRRQQLIHCVADLRKAGIKFRSWTGDQFWDIKFKDGVLYIPPLLIHEGTKSLFLNLIAFEQCHLECGNRITSYVTFMDNLINSDVDVGFLHDKEIIEHWLGNDGEVADMFNRLCKEVVFDRYDCYLSEVSEQVNHYYKNKYNNLRASFCHKYFSNPWAFISMIAAVVLLLLTVAQTVYSVYGYYKPK